MSKKMAPRKKPKIPKELSIIEIRAREYVDGLPTDDGWAALKKDVGIGRLNRAIQFLLEYNVDIQHLRPENEQLHTALQITEDRRAKIHHGLHGALVRCQAARAADWLTKLPNEGPWAVKLATYTGGHLVRAFQLLLLKNIQLEDVLPTDDCLEAALFMTSNYTDSVSEIATAIPNRIFEIGKGDYPIARITL